MIEKQLKRAIWVMNEIIQASTRGITREELSDKWANSASNDWKDKDIPERTFYRIRNMLQSVFDVDIECIKGAEPRYRVSSEYLEPGSSNLLSLLLNKKESEKKSKPSYILDILNLIMTGREIPDEDATAVKAIAEKLNRVPFDSGKQLITSVEAGEIQGADCVDWDEDYRGYVCVWNDADYKRTDLWVSIGFYDDRVLFYVVTSVQEATYRENVSRLLEVDNGEIYRSDYWWYEPMDKSLFQLDFQTFPDMEEVKRRVELLIAKIAELPDDLQKPEE
ncbi:MAG: hypothetical protein K2G24_10735 [Muribaculaceae bacterium]|nr:hypothetical protein [Muribaculaceae bacterium]